MERKPKLLRIATVSHSFDFLLKGQLNYVKDKGFDITIACTYDKDIERIVSREGVSYKKIDLTRKLSPFKDLKSLFQTIRLIRELKPDIVHTHSPKAGIVGMLAAWFCRVPLRIHTVAGLPLTETFGVKKRILVLVERITYYCANYVLPNSKEQKEFIISNIYNNPKIQVIGSGSSNGIDLEYFDSNSISKCVIDNVTDKYAILKNDIVICFVGRLANYKGINELVKAFQILQDINPINIKLFLVGPYETLNPLEAETLKIIESNQSIFDVGHQDDIRPFLAISDIFVFPSYREGFPQSLMQAAAMNLACVASDINGCNEIICNNKNGLLIEPKSINAIVEAVDKLINDNELRSLFSFNAKILMESEFEQISFWNKIIDFYNEKL